MMGVYPKALYTGFPRTATTELVLDGDAAPKELWMTRMAVV
jgi:hypothetical protein